MASPPAGVDLTGIWSCDDGGLYFIRQIGETVMWAGLDAGLVGPPGPEQPPLFFRGTVFANVFQGSFVDDGYTVRGEWADVPRGATANFGAIAFALVEEAWHQWTLQRIDEATTGGFSGSVWRQDGYPLTAQDIVSATHSVYRYGGDETLGGLGHIKTLGENNPPCRDFSVMWGEVTVVDTPNFPPGGNDYCSFLADWDGDGDIAFSIHPIFRDEEHPFGTDLADFWTTGWVPNSPDEFDDLPVDHIAKLFQKYKYFHCEVPMFGRGNSQDFCADPPESILPGWNEAGGNSVLVNGIPVEGKIQVDQNVSPPAITFTTRPDRIGEDQLALMGTVRVLGVVADDAGHEGETPPEIHPVYAIDFVTAGVQSSVLSGAWHSSDNGTYYVRQLGDAVWWLGLSRDQGRTFANVFKGAVVTGGVEGTWFDVPMTFEPVLTQGEVVIAGDETAISLTKTFETPRFGSPAGLGASSWQKLYDGPGFPAGDPNRPHIGPARE
jgi:hypothetical protein